jgi:hypothetical protein
LTSSCEEEFAKKEEKSGFGLIMKKRLWVDNEKASEAVSFSDIYVILHLSVWRHM